MKTRRGWWLVLAVAAVTAAAYVVQPPIAVPIQNLTSTLSMIVPFTAAMLWCWRAGWHRQLIRRTRVAWRLFGLATGFNVASWAIWQIPALTAAHSFTLIATPLYLGMYAPLLGGLICLPANRARRGEWARLALDVLMVGLSAAMLSWYLVIGPLVRAGAPDLLYLIVTLAYPVGDLVLVSCTVGLLLRGVPQICRRPLQLMVAVVTLGAAVDTCYAYGSLHSLAWLLQWAQPAGSAVGLLTAAAAQAQLDAAGRTGPAAAKQVGRGNRRVSRLPYLAVAAAYALLLGLGREVPLYPLGGLILGAVVLTAVVLARQLTVVNDNRVLALTDGLTGLANPAQLHSRLADGLKSARRARTRLAVLLIDLDKFKPINDSFGHETGDAILIAVAQRLRDGVRPSDTVARLGGDEFAVILQGLAEPANATQVTVRLMEHLCGPVVVNQHILEIAASVGVAVYAPDVPTADELLHRADMAMYAAKSAGTNEYRIYSAELAADSPHVELRRAIEGDELVLYYQPIVDLAAHEPVGLEALVRWQHPTRGLLFPDQFIPTAEASGLIVPLGAWVLDRACAQLREWSATAPSLSGLTLNINVSAHEVNQLNFVAEVTAALDRHRIAPAAIVLELTESSSLVQETGAVARLQALRELGIRIAVDDFGTGYSTLSYLRQVPIDILKIDRSFVNGINDDPDSRIIGDAIIRLGHALKLQVIAEGIETYDQQQALEQMSCHYGQGYLLARPQSAADTVESLTDMARQHRAA